MTQAAAAVPAAQSLFFPPTVVKAASPCKPMAEPAATPGPPNLHFGNRHGPGGGGAGGVILVSGAPASLSVTGAASGTTENPGVTYGSTAGAAGASVTNATISSTSGTQSGAQCTPDMTLGKSHVGNFTRGLTASYTVPVSNVSPYGTSSGTVIVNDTLPLGLTPTSATGTGWSCSIVSQTVSCTDSTALPAGGSYPSITISAAVTPDRSLHRNQHRDRKWRRRTQSGE